MYLGNGKIHTIRFVFCRIVTRIGSDVVTSLSIRPLREIVRHANSTFYDSAERARTGEFYRCHLPVYVFALLAAASFALVVAHWVRDVVGTGTARQQVAHRTHASSGAQFNRKKIWLEFRLEKRIEIQF